MPNPPGSDDFGDLPPELRPNARQGSIRVQEQQQAPVSLQHAVQASLAIGVRSDAGTTTTTIGAEHGNQAPPAPAPHLSDADTHRVTYEVRDPFLRRVQPKYYAFIDRKAAEVARLVAPVDRQIADVQRARDAIPSGWERFFGNPLSVISSALSAVATSGASLGADIARRAISTAGNDPDAARAALDREITKLQAQRTRIVRRVNTPWRFEEMNPLPKGVTQYMLGAGPHGQAVATEGTGPLHKSFWDWYKKRRK